MIFLTHFRQCSDSRQAYGPIPDLSGAEQFAAELVTLPCSFLIERDAHVRYRPCNDTTSLTMVTSSLADLICEARRLSVNLKNAFLFMIWANSFVSLLHIFALIALLPPILTGYHILWLTSVPIPLLTMSLLNSPAEPGVWTHHPFECWLISWLRPHERTNWASIRSAKPHRTVCHVLSSPVTPNLCAISITLRLVLYLRP